MKQLTISFFLLGAIFANEGFGYLNITNRGDIYSSDYRGMGVFSVCDGIYPIDNPTHDRGRYTCIADDYLLFKKITDDGHIPCIYFLNNKRTYEMLPPSASCGVPRKWGDSFVIAVEDRIVIWHDGIIVREFPNERRVQFIDIDIVHGRAAYTDDDGYIVILDFETGEARKIFNQLGFKPRWSPDGTKIALLSSEGIVVLDYESGETWEFEEGLKYVWDPVGVGLFIQKLRSNLTEIFYSDLYYFIPGGEKIKLTNTIDVHEGMHAISPDGKWLAYTHCPQGDVYRARISREGEMSLTSEEFIAYGRDCPIIPFEKHHSGAKSDIWIPYLHQVYDVPDDFNGSSSCGPTSGLMAIQRFGKLPPHPITCSEPYSHNHDFGWYVPNEYEYNGYLYDHPGLAPKVGDYYSDTTVYGAHGFCVSTHERVGTWGDSLVALINQHGLSSGWASCSWSWFTGEIDDGNPVCALLTFGTSGHYNCWRGYFTDHVVVSNDPYGDHNHYPWKQYNGECVFYDWEGYDNGYYEPELRWFFYARGTYAKPSCDTLVDDLTSGFAMSGPGDYWRAHPDGYDDRFMWTGTVVSGDDVNYATWTPVLPEDGEYEVFAYIPPVNATADANYQIHHTGGTAAVVIDQTIYSAEWVSLGTYSFVNGNYVYVGDVTGTSGDELACDAIKWHWLGEPFPDTLIDDEDPGFHRYADPAFWHEGIGGYENHFWWTYSTLAADTCYCEWIPILPTVGDYEVLVYIPSTDAVANARYKVHHSGGIDTVIVNQSLFFNEWVSIGEYSFAGESGEKVYLGDATGESGNRIAFDAVWWHLTSVGTDRQNCLPLKTTISVYPNPFNNACVLRIIVPDNNVLKISDISGRQVAEFSLNSGENRITWIPDNLPSGYYFASIENIGEAIKILYVR